MKKLIVLLLGIWIVGCATTAKYEEMLNTWVGHDINELVSSNWGYPQSSFQAPNGNTVYIYSSQGSYTMPTNTTLNVYGNTGYATTTGGQTLNFWCQTFFEVDSNKKIVRWQYKGNKCHAR